MRPRAGNASPHSTQKCARSMRASQATAVTRMQSRAVVVYRRAVNTWKRIGSWAHSRPPRQGPDTPHVYSPGTWHADLVAGFVPGRSAIDVTDVTDVTGSAMADGEVAAVTCVLATRLRPIQIALRSHRCPVRRIVCGSIPIVDRSLADRWPLPGDRWRSLAEKFSARGRCVCCKPLGPVCGKRVGGVG